MGEREGRQELARSGSSKHKEDITTKCRATGNCCPHTTGY